MDKYVGRHKTYVFSNGKRKLVKEVEDYVYTPFSFTLLAVFVAFVAAVGYMVL